MCGIIDANVSHQVFGESASDAGLAFLNWIEQGQKRLVVGGKNLSELSHYSRYRIWSRKASSRGIIRKLNDEAVTQRERELKQNRLISSDDQHVLALAQLSGARLLFTNDKRLRRDFKNKRLIDQPQGKVYSTLEGHGLQDYHKRLLKRKDLCGPPPRSRE